MKITAHIRLLLTVGLAATLFSAFSALGESESAWVHHQYAKSRIVANLEGVPANVDALIYLGWEVVLPEGWKTYWRTPGDAGRPPSFDWSGSINLRAAEVLYPQPQRFEIFGLQTFGYESAVIIPVRLYPEHAGLPVHVQLSVWFMACQEICVPFETSYSLDLPTVESVELSPHAFEINKRLALVPKDSAEAPTGLILKTARVRGQAGNQRLTVLIEGDRLMSGADVIIEAGQEFRFGLPQKALLGDGKRARFVIPIGSYLDNADLRGKRVTFTIRDGRGTAIERTIQLDLRDQITESLAKSD